MKINAYNPRYNVDLSGATGLIASSASYSHTALGSNTPKIESGSGSPGSGPQASAWDHVHPAFGGSTSFGSNSNSVGTANSAGASSSNSRADHVHKGVSSIAKSGSAALVGDVTLTGGSNVTLTQSGQDISIAATGSGGTITTKDEGSTLSSTVTTLDFVGAGVSASGGGATTTITIPGAGVGSGLTIPSIVQAVVGTNQVTSMTVTAAASGNSFILFTDSTTGQISAVSSTNTTWTQIKTHTGTGAFYAIWVGKVAGGSSGTTVTITKPGTFNSTALLEVTDTLTPTAGSTNSATSTNNSGLVANTLRIASPTTGRLVVFGYGNDNTAAGGRLYTNIPTGGVHEGIIALAVGYATSSSVFADVFNAGGAGATVIAEVT